MRLRELATVALLSTTLVALEMIWTRLLSAEFYYTFAFLILSLAIMGLGLGGLTVRLLPGLARRDNPGETLSLTVLSSLIGPLVVFRLGLNLSLVLEETAVLGKLIFAVLLLALPFFFGGMALALLFRRRPDEMPRLYMADLGGAALGVGAAVVMMNLLGTPRATFFLALPAALAALLQRGKSSRLVPWALTGLAIFLMPDAEARLEVPRQERGPVIYKHWDAMSKIKLYGYGREYRSINIDNIANSPVYGFDGDWQREEPFQFGIDVSYLIGLFDDCTFLSLGAGGGSDVLQALQAGAGEIHAVEVNSHINHMLEVGDVSGYLPADPAAHGRAPVEPGNDAEEQVGEEVMTLAEFSGHIYRDPRVRVASEDARAYVRQHEGRFDLIYSLSSNTFSALASGSFALAENYLFTTEAFVDYWRALSGGGFLMMEHQFYMPRLVSSAIDALAVVGIDDPRLHMAVYNLPQMRRNILLLSKRPLTDEIRRRAFGELSPERHEEIHLLYPAGEEATDNLVRQIIDKGWRLAATDAPVDISPTTDDRPFIGQMGLWRNISLEEDQPIRPLEVFGFPLARILILVILAVVVVLILPLNLLPFFTRGPQLGALPWLYFFLIGIGFMAVEVVLIQQFTLFIGPSAYSIAVILLALLLASGIGSRLAQRVDERLVFGGIALWLVVDILLFAQAAEALAGLGISWRMLLTAIVVAPLGFLMGMPFPKGALRVGSLIDWGFAVNGAASVLGATGILLVTFGWGLRAALAVGALTYLLAFVTFRRHKGWGDSAVPSGRGGE